MTVPNETDKASRKAAVYRLYAADGALLYIGSSYDPDKRCEAHYRAPWWPEVARRTDEWMENRWKAYSAETSAIWKEQPKHNLAGTRGYTRPGSGSPYPPKQRASYLAYTGRRDACATLDLRPLYMTALDDPDRVDLVYVRRAEQAASVLIEDMQGIGWNGRRRTVEKGRQLVARQLRNEGATDADVATVLAVVDARIARLPYLTDDEPHGSRRAADGSVTYVVYAEPIGSWWSCSVVALGYNSRPVQSFGEIEDTSRIAISKWTGLDYEKVAVRIRTADEPEASDG